MIRPDLLADHESTKQVALLLDNENETLHKRIAQLVDQLAQLTVDSGHEQLALELATPLSYRCVLAVCHWGASASSWLRFIRLTPPMPMPTCRCC